MSIIDDSVCQLKILSGNVDDIAIFNMLNAKLANLVSLAGMRFKQFSNGNDRTISYYGINFMGSGEKKDYTVDNINYYLLPFVKNEFQKKIDSYKDNFYRLNIENETDKRKKDKALQQYDNIRVENFELEEPNYTGLYAEALQYNLIGFGCIFIRISEFGDYIENITSGNQSKKEVYQKLKNIFEGKISAPIIGGNSKRITIENMPVQCLLYSDFENFINPKTKKAYIASLKTGVARRSFIYMNTKQNPLSYPLRHYEMEEAINSLKNISITYKNIFNYLLNKTNKTLLFSQESDDLLYQYQCDCIDYFNKYKNKDIITRNDVKESFWKIQKLSCVYSLILNTESNLVNPEYVQMAINFYNQIKNGLETVINTRELDVVEKFAKYFYDNKEKEIITTMELRKLNYINPIKFSKEFDLILNEIQDELSNNYKCNLYNMKSQKNTKAYKVKVEKEDNLTCLI